MKFVLGKADKTETCKFFMNIMWIGYSYTTTTINFLVFSYMPFTNTI